MQKQLVINFNLENDGSITTSITDSVGTFTLYELFMAYKHIEAILNQSHFDWSTESTINCNLKEEK